MLILSVLCHDMVVFCHDRNFLLQLFNFVAAVSAMLRHSFYCYYEFMLRQTFFVAIVFLPVAWIFCRDILFFVVIVLCCLVLLRMNSVLR